MSCASCSKKTVFANENGSVLQCDVQNCYFLEFKGQLSSFKVGDFLAFKRKIDSFNIEHKLIDTSPGADVELIMPFRCGVFFILQITDILQLRELLEGAKFMIDLNSVLKTQKIVFSSEQGELA